MKNLIFFTASLLMVCNVVMAQTLERFDLATYTPPKGWKKELLKDVVSYTAPTNQKGTFCRIALYKSVHGSGILQTTVTTHTLPGMWAV